MGTSNIPTNFKWVKARANCSLFEVFKRLRNGVGEDVEERNSIPHSDSINWHVGAETGKAFSVFREEQTYKGPQAISVDFVLSDNEITVSDGEHIFLRGAVTLNNEGECKLKVGAEELELWQVRRIALEQIFFDTPAVKLRRSGSTNMQGV